MTESKHKISPPPDPVQIGDRLHSAAIHLLRRVRARDSISGVGPAQLSALSVLVFGGPRSLGELADAEQVRPPTMSRIVTSLVHSGLVRRKPTDDKRRIRLEPTAKGTKILQEGRQRRVELLAQVLQTLDPQELQQAAHLVEFLQTLVRRL
jgi:DNA-binding MarR family transcriptional regulator